MQLGTCEIEYHLVGDENVAQELWVEGKVMEQVLESLKNKCFEGWVKDDKGFEVEFDFGDRGVEQEPQISLNVEWLVAVGVENSLNVEWLVAVGVENILEVNMLPGELILQIRKDFFVDRDLADEHPVLVTLLFVLVSSLQRLQQHQDLLW